MSNVGAVKRVPRVVFFGMQGSFSAPVLKALLAQEIVVCGVVVPSSPINGRSALPIQRREPPSTGRSSLPIANLTPSMVELAWAKDIPVWEVERLKHPETIQVLSECQPDFFCVACFSTRLPRVILDIPRLGCLNVHPSLLPENRGPVPLFWTFRHGEETTGVTIHYMEDELDSGDILGQEIIPVPEGISYARLEVLCASQGGRLLARVLQEVYEGRAVRHPQRAAGSSYQAFPEERDFLVQPLEWSARHVYNFICGVGRWNGPIVLVVQDRRFVVRDAISYSLNDEAEPGEAEPLYYHDDGEVVVRCRDGWVRTKML